MADIAKAVQLVSNSNGVQDSVAMCDLISLCDASNNVDKSEKDNVCSSETLADLSFQLPSGDEGSSLQDLIDSELALRISNKLDDETYETDKDDDCYDNVYRLATSPKPEIQITPDSDTENSDFLDINTQFILSERSHCLKNMPGNGSHFFTTITDDDDIDLDNCDDVAIYNSNEQECSPNENIEISFSGINCSTSEDLETHTNETVDFQNQSSGLVQNQILTPPPEDVDAKKFPLQDFVNVCSEKTENSTEIDGYSSHDSKSPTECAKLYLNSVNEGYDSIDKSNCVTKTGDVFETLSDCLSQQPDHNIPNFPSDTSNTSDPFVKVDNSMVDFTTCVVSNIENLETKVDLSEVNNVVPLEDDLVVLKHISDNQNEVKLACGDNENVCELAKNSLHCVNSLELSSNFMESTIPDEANETTSNTAEKKIKKKKNEGADSVKIKKTKKNKKSESEKENISVIENYSELTQTNNSIQSDSDVVSSNYSNTDLTVCDEVTSGVTVNNLIENKFELKKTNDPYQNDFDDMPCNHSNTVPTILIEESASLSVKDLIDNDSELTKTNDPNHSDPDDVTPIHSNTVPSSVSVNNLIENEFELTNANDPYQSDPDDMPSNNSNTVPTLLDEGLSSVSVKGLKSAYSNINDQVHDNYTKEVDDDLVYCGSIDTLKETYCNEASKGFTKTQSLEKEEIVTGISISKLRSSFSKFDQLSKKTVLHVRSVDAAKVQQQFNQANLHLYAVLDSEENSASVTPEQTNNCRSCEKQVFQMEQIKAERSVWHKNCFRCKECNKQLTVDTYSSHEGQLYCKPHFKELFKPKAVLDEDSDMPILRKPKMIICENEPVELPPDVVRASSKPDLGLEELTSLNVKSRFQVFEKAEDNTNDIERSASSVSVKRSPSILSKLARFQAKGMDIGVTDDSLNGIPYEESSSSSEEDDDSIKEGEAELVKSCRKQRERPMSFNKMDDIKCKWETGQAARKEERREERKQEIQSIRSRLFLGKQGKMKEMYEQAVIDSERGSQKKGVDVGSDRARTIKEKFERGEVLADDDELVNKEEQARKAKEEELSLFEAGISKKSRSLFMELDASAVKNQQQPLLSPVKSPSPRDDVRKAKEAFTGQTSKDIVRASDTVDDVKIETSDVSNKFKFFETYKEAEKPKSQFRITPPREGQVKEKSPDNIIYRDPNVVRSDDKIEEEVIRSKTTSKMLSLFRQLEENANKEEVPEGPKPLKCFTPPPDYTKDTDSSETESQSEDEDNEEYDETGYNPNLVRSSDKIDDEILQEARNAARAKVLRAKFERWEEKESKLNGENGGGNLDKPENEQSEQASIDSTKTLLAKFESMKNEGNQPKERVRPRVNRFVDVNSSASPDHLCDVCSQKVYALEKIKTNGKVFHKQCFRCVQCNCILRMDSYAPNHGKLYCLTHFKQLFISKGNYEEGFGVDKIKKK